MCATLELEDPGFVTYEWAADQNANIIERLTHLPARNKLYNLLSTGTDAICCLVKHHLQLNHRDVCIIAPQDEWLQGSFNVCIPIEVQSSKSHRKVVLRCCLPYKLAESRYPGTVDEKLRCEVGAYTWMQENCTDIRIPHLYGFGLSNNHHFTHEEHRPWYIRLSRIVQRCLYVALRYSVTLAVYCQSDEPSSAYRIRAPRTHRP